METIITKKDVQKVISEIGSYENDIRKYRGMLRTIPTDTVSVQQNILELQDKISNSKRELSYNQIAYEDDLIAEKRRHLSVIKQKMNRVMIEKPFDIYKMLELCGQYTIV